MDKWYQYHKKCLEKNFSRGKLQNNNWNITYKSQSGIKCMNDDKKYLLIMQDKYKLLKWEGT